MDCGCQGVWRYLLDSVSYGRIEAQSFWAAGRCGVNADLLPLWQKEGGTVWDNEAGEDIVCPIEFAR